MKIFRKKYLINPQFQLPFIFRTVLMAGAIIFILYVSNIYIFWKFNELGEAMNLPANHKFYSFISKQVELMNVVFFGTSALVLFSLTFFGLMLSHRIAGPLYRLKKHITDLYSKRDEISADSIKEVKFRKKDFFQDIAEAYNLHLSLIKIPSKSSKLTLIEGEKEDYNDSEKQAA